MTGHAADVDRIDDQVEDRPLRLRSPPHPGRIVRQECLEPLGLSVTEAAKALGVSRVALFELVNERCSVSPEMAIRLAKAFGGSPEVWAGLQLDFDLARAMTKAGQIKVRGCSCPSRWNSLAITARTRRAIGGQAAREG